MPRQSRPDTDIIPRVAETLVLLRRNSGLTQQEVARRMGTTQAAVARLESGSISPTMSTIQGFARANGYCFELGFIRADSERTGWVLVVDDGEQEKSTGK